MKLTYETGLATFVQLAVISLLNIPNSLSSIVTTCHKAGGDCISNLITSVILYMLLVFAFSFIWGLGFVAQEKRSKHLARLLIAVEALVVLISIFNLKHHATGHAFFSRMINGIDLVLAVWVIILAYRLMKAKGGRVVVSKARTRQRRKHVQEDKQ